MRMRLWLLVVASVAVGFAAGYGTRTIVFHPPCEIVVADGSFYPTDDHYDCMVKALTNDVAYQCAYLRCGWPPSWEPVENRFADCPLSASGIDPTKVAP